MVEAGGPGAPRDARHQPRRRDRAAAPRRGVNGGRAALASAGSGPTLDAIYILHYIISGKAAGLRYAFHDYPTMLVFDADGRPAPPFNVSVPFRSTGK